MSEVRVSQCFVTTWWLYTHTILLDIRQEEIKKIKGHSQCGIDKIFDRVNSYLSELYDAVKVFTANGEQTRGKHTVH